MPYLSNIKEINPNIGKYITIEVPNMECIEEKEKEDII